MRAFFELLLMAILVKGVVTHKWARQVCMEKWENGEALSDEKEAQKARYNGAEEAEWMATKQKTQGSICTPLPSRSDLPLRLILISL